MIFQPDFKSLILLFVVLQELVFAAILLRKGIKDGVSSDRWLSLLIMLCALYMTPWMLGKAGWYAEEGYREFLFFIPFHQYFLFGPVMYFLTLSLTGESLRGCQGKWLHFLPAYLYLLYSFVIVITDLVILDQFYFYSDGMDKDFKPWYQITGLFSMCTYAYLSIRQYISYKKWIYQVVSFVELVKYGWLRDFLIALMLIIIFRGVFIIIFPEIGDWGFKWWYYLMSSFRIIWDFQDY